MSSLDQAELSPDFAPMVFRIVGEVTEEFRQPVLPVIGEDVKSAVRTLLRYGGHKPSGRGRPASETLLKALKDGRYPQIHPVVDFFNSLSLATGLPISVLDEECLQGKTGFRVGRPEESYVFNPSGQEMKLQGLLLVEDSEGPVGTPVKDSQRTKIRPDSTRFFIVVWGTRELPELSETVRGEVLSWAEQKQLEICETS